MTGMRRVTIAMPDELDKRIMELKQSDAKLVRASYSEVMRIALDKGLTAISTAPRPQWQGGERHE